MPKKFSINGSQAVASPTDSVLGLTSATTVRPEIYHFVLGCQATPADNALNWLLQRYTAAGTATAVTPHALDPSDPAALASAGEDHSVEPTYTAGAILGEFSVNQRASLPWYAREGREIKLPATAANGVGWQPVHASFTGVVDVTAHYQE
jgi:hypothetical protein